VTWMRLYSRMLIAADAMLSDALESRINAVAAVSVLIYRPVFDGDIAQRLFRGQLVCRCRSPLTVYRSLTVRRTWV